MGSNLLLESLSHELDGEVAYDDIIKTAYSTDASVYRELPMAVVWPANTSDLKKLIKFCNTNGISLTVRAAGTSLAGQVVGKGIIADISRHMTRILNFNPDERWVLVEPGVIPDELNIFLKPYGLQFGPETSTSNRCTIGGMAGNNACGLHSLVYGSTREHLLEVKCLLSDGSEVVLNNKSPKEINQISSGNTLEAKIYSELTRILSDPVNAEHIRNGYPNPSITRRNTGYCLDIMLDSEPFTNEAPPFNLAKLIAGSEGTLAIVTELKLNLVPLPPPAKGLLCVHLKDRSEAFRANLTALEHKPSAIEMMDDRILKLTENNLSQRNNRFFISGEPGAILIIEINGNSDREVIEKAEILTENLQKEKFGYHFPLITGKDISRVWNLRKAGLGILSNMQGDARPVSLIEDTAVTPEDLPDYMEELTALLQKYGKETVLHAHIGTGELHVRPVLNLKDPGDVAVFREIAKDTALLVKKYRGSLSGEHGDGRLRGEFIPVILGEHNYRLIERVKKTWDPANILNPGIITGSLPANSHLRHDSNITHFEPETILDFSDTGGIVRAAEKCNGSADCRKSVRIGGIMCPTFMATGDERLSTRARANILTSYLPGKNRDDWNSREIYEILDLCISCKGCKAECPSGVDIAKMKAEFLQHWNDRHGISLRTWLIANITFINRLGSLLPPLFNYLVTNRVTSSLVKGIVGFAKKRSVPSLYRITLTKWLSKNLDLINPKEPIAEVCLFVDEFTNYNDTETGIKAVKLLTSLNYRVLTVNNSVSGRTYISKGLLRKAKVYAAKNIEIVYPIAERGIPVIGIEPSAILSFRDEYPDLVRGELKEKALLIKRNVMTFEEFISAEFRKGNIESQSFTDKQARIFVHVHCQQKAVSSSSPTIETLSIPSNYHVREIETGCCGMAGSFGYEKEHFDLSNKIGELVLFPEIRAAGNEVLLSAPGTSCRHHISDGTGRIARHPAVILYEALNIR
jgi:FAD/FMN-containing dehydrogenase/Fe-S oxidoreductase